MFALLFIGILLKFCFRDVINFFMTQEFDDGKGLWTEHVAKKV